MKETWKNKKYFQGTNKNYSVSKVLRDKKKVTDEFEAIFNSLSLEEVIALKLELAAKSAGSLNMHLVLVTRKQKLKTS